VSRKAIQVIVGFILVGVFVVCGLLYLLPQLVIQSPPNGLTIIFGEKARSVIEAFELTSGSLPVKLNRNMLSNLMTGELLARQLSGGEFSTHYITTSIELREVRVLEYSSLQFKAIGCGQKNLVEVTSGGAYIRTLPRWTFQKIYVFNREDDAWKLAAAYDFTDHDGAIRDWRYVLDWERDLIGPLPDYVREHGSCGFDR